MSRSTPRVAARVDLTPSAEFRVVLATYLWTASAVPAALLVESELLALSSRSRIETQGRYEDVLPMPSTYRPRRRLGIDVHGRCEYQRQGNPLRGCLVTPQGLRSTRSSGCCSIQQSSTEEI